MANNLYFYSYGELTSLIENIEKYANVNERCCEGFIEYTVKIYKKDLQKVQEDFVSLYTKKEVIKFIILKNLKIISIITEKYSHIKDFYNENKLKKLNLLNNKIFYIIFKKQFSTNLMKLSMSTTSLSAIIDDVELVGNELHNSDILYNLNTYIFDKSTKLNAYSFKPKSYNFIVNVTAINKIQLRSKNILEKDIISFIIEFMVYLNKYGGLYGE